MSDFETKGVWNKTGEEITVGDAYKIMAVETVVTTVVLGAIMGGFYGVATIIDRRRAKKALKLESEQKNTEVQ